MTSKGFTLVEVLIASVILFFSITTLSTVIQSGILTNSKANDRLLTLQQIPLVIDAIKIEIYQSSKKKILRGKGSFINGSYTWEAKLVKQDSAPAIIDAETGANQAADNLFYLWEVGLTVSSGNWEKSYMYNEISWGQ